jgi:hypothetical protein
MSFIKDLKPREGTDFSLKYMEDNGHKKAGSVARS